MKRVWMGAVLAMLLVGTLTHAQDREERRLRRIFGVNLGIGLSSFDRGSDSTVNKVGFGGSIKAGYGLSDQLFLLLDGEANSFTDEFDNNMVTGNETIGFRYYLNPDSHSLYLGAGIGLSVLRITPEYNNFFGDTATATGLGFQGHVGYELSSHWNMEVGVGYGQPKATVLFLDSGLEERLTFKILTATATVGYLFY